MERKINLDWVTIKEFENAVPSDMLHKEQDSEAAGKLEAKKSGQKNVHVLFRTSFVNRNLSGNVRMLITADDYYKLYINGRFAAQGPAPSYPENYYYNTLDITDYLVPGENSVAVHLYYQGLINRVWNSGDNRCALGTSLFAGDEKVPLDWFYTVSDAFSGVTAGYDTQFTEDFDSRKWDENWCTSDSFKKEYKKAVPAAWADYAISAQPTEMLDVYEALPVSVSCGKKWLFVDFGKEITGTLRLSAKGKAGSVVTIRSGEELLDDKLKSVRYEMRCNCVYEEKWTLKAGCSTYEGYDYKGFRYVEFLFDEETEIKTVKAVVRHYPFDDSFCTYRGKDEKLKAIFDLCKYTVKLGTQENYIDCPTREKGQYLGDAIITARAQVHLTGKTDMLRKCIAQFAETARVCPGLLAVAPGAYMQEIADFSLLWSELLLTDFYFTKDKVFLKKYCPVAEGIIRHFAQYENKEGLLECVADKWNLVDWPENLRDDYDFALTRPVVAKGCHNVINALYIGAMVNLCEIKKILGSKDREAFKAELGVKIENFNKAFIDETTGLYRDSLTSRHSSLHANVYPCYYGIVPQKNVDGICSFIEKKGLRCGVFLSYFALKGLIRNNHKDAAYRLLTNESEHGWLNMISEGATTAFEAWGRDQKWNTSLCHPWASGPVSIILEDFS